MRPEAAASTLGGIKSDRPGGWIGGVLGCGWEGIALWDGDAAALLDGDLWGKENGWVFGLEPDIGSVCGDFACAAVQ